ncbi:hypothetical protein [Ancylobacter sp. SL191]|uniref:hypothetical protein n=1 Tax=Ancylobacter sp. SL191 TaxID=2995166 RepID=UPI00227087E4|nr:hypothetical protein [Ancylobacter sp. SL191]WAC26313.1 hypothetical protein OU996_15005 [Ancylobacter sp. SL191]
MKIAPPEQLRRLIGEVERKLDSLPYAGRLDRPERIARRLDAGAEALARLRRRKGVKVNDGWGGTALRLGGIHVTCKSRNPELALQSWLSTARRRLAEIEGARA